MIALIQFFVRNQIRNRRMIWMILLSLVPVVTCVALSALRPLMKDSDLALAPLFPQMIQVMYLHFMLPLLCLFVGTSAIADEVKDRTLPYLIIRPVPKWQIILSKNLVGFVTVSIFLFISLGMTYSILMMDEGLGDWVGHLSMLFKNWGVTLLGVAVYLPIFSIIGGVFQKPVLASLIFAFGWESHISFFPGNLKLFTLVYYLHRLTPQVEKSSLFHMNTPIISFIMKQTQVSLSTAWIVLMVSILVFWAGSLTVLYFKEYRMTLE